MAAPARTAASHPRGGGIPGTPAAAATGRTGGAALTMPWRGGIRLPHGSCPPPGQRSFGVAVAAPRRAAGPCASALLTAPGCSIFRSPVIARGNRPSAEQIKDISVGVHTRSDVQALLGSPTSSSAFGDQSWYYISAQTRLRPMQHFGIADPETVAVDFDKQGVVKAVRVMTEADMNDVRMVSRETPSPGNDRTLMQALFGNVGRVGPAPTDGANAQSAPNAAAR